MQESYQQGVRLVSGRRFDSPLRLSGLALHKLWFRVDTASVVTLPLTINETLKWLSALPILMQDHFGGDSVVLSIDRHLLPTIINKTLKWLSPLSILMQK